MLYKFVYGKQSYYDLAMTRHVEPKTKYDNDDEAEGDDNEKEAEGVGLLAKNEERNGAEVRRKEYSAPRNAPQYKRKKQHWQVSPYVKVRVKNRIRRWDGYLYVIHI
jgi:hypothetical protein